MSHVDWNWATDTGSAQLSVGSLSAAIDLENPIAGLRHFSADGTPLPIEHALAIVSPLAPRGPIDGYQRGRDLIATYKAADRPSISAHVYWTALDSPVLGVELVVSTQTQLLDADPGVSLSTVLTCDEVVRPTCDRFDRFERIPASRDYVARATDPAPALFVFRLAGAEFSYAEFVHPADFASAQLDIASDSGNKSRIRQMLFSGRFEKGVIRRGRTRAILLPREDDTRIAARHYQAFLDSPSRLTA